SSDPSRAHRLLHPSPTRRSSDLTERASSPCTAAVCIVHIASRPSRRQARSRQRSHRLALKVRCPAHGTEPPWLCGAFAGSRSGRSEEHTSELQSRENLVCRLLLE